MTRHPFPSFCRKHGEGCAIPWGYDPNHTDSDHPYSVDELERRQEAPHRFAYPSAREYEFGFYIWRSMRRDDRLTRDEERAREPVILARLGIKASSYDEALQRFA